MATSRTATPVVAFVVLALAATACGSAQNKQTAAPPKALVATAKAKRQADPTLVRFDRPGAVILRQWRYFKSGAVPAAVLMYSSKVRRRVGVGTLAGAAARLQDQLANYTPVVVEQERTSAGQLVMVDAINGSAKPVRYSYLMRIAQGEWVITYDTLMPSALAGYIQTRVQDSIAPDATRPAREALKAVAVATDRFRVAHLDEPATSGGRPSPR